MHAAVVLRQPPLTPVNPQDIITWCHSQLALYKCPTTIHLMDELPTTGSGKVLKKVLRATFSHGSGAAAPAAAAASSAVTAAPAAEMPSSAVPILVVASAAAQAAVNAVAPYFDHSASDAHTPSRAASRVKGGGQVFSHELLDAVAAQFPAACMLNMAAAGAVLDPAQCHLSVVDDWTAAVTQVSTCVPTQQQHRLCQSCTAKFCCTCSKTTSDTAACSSSVACTMRPEYVLS